MELEAPLTDDEFAGLMDTLGPFEARPHLAVAVSGGPDSLCLTLLLQRWARRRKGRITALTVDHRLRTGSAEEASQVRRWLRPHGVAHRILSWDRGAGSAPIATGLQAAARAARYELLCAACRQLGILHLAVAHHRDDQAETFLLRLARGSGLDGLAAMAPVSERNGIRLLRPLLPVSRQRLAATLQARRQQWIDDPSNQNMAHTRVRLRHLQPALAEIGLTAGRLSETATALGQARRFMEDAVADLLARAVEADPAGYLWLDPASLLSAPAELSQRALARCLMAIGGEAYPPRLERLRRLQERIAGGRLGAGATLAGCRIVALRGRLLICRELAAAAPARRLRAGDPALWDGRFAIRLAGHAGHSRRLQVAALGAEGYRDLLRRRPDLKNHPIPALARLVLPALWGLDKAALGPLAVPHLDYRVGNPQVSVDIEFVPAQALTPTRFTVA